MKQNLIFASGDASPIPLAIGERRFLVEEQQTRLIVGPFQFVLTAEPDRGKPALWALPGGARASTAQLLDLARRNEWKRPAQILVTIRRAHDNDIRCLRASLTVSQETHGE